MLIITGGNLNSDFSLDFIKKNNFKTIISVDSATQFCFDNKIFPNYIIGDMDSLKNKSLLKNNFFEKSKIIKLNPVKDLTDTHYALNFAISLKPKKIYILGASGTRLDHTLSNINILVNTLENNIETFIIDKNSKLCLINKDKNYRLHKKDAFGKFLSILPFTDEISGVTINGAKYNLNNASLLKKDSIGISNEFCDNDYINIKINSGIAIIIESKD